VPIVEPPEMPRWEETAPPPRKVAANKPAPRDQWDFLKPVSRLSDSPAPH
jgi:hypothetical protein